MKNHDLWILIGALCPTAAIIGWMLLDNACSAVGDTRYISECWRGWIGASSGWAAMIAGAATILVLIYQTRKHEEIAHREHIDAKEVFFHEVSQVLQRLNKIWKLAEDIEKDGRDSEHYPYYINNLKDDLKRARSFSTRNTITEPIGSLHRIDQKRARALVKQCVMATTYLTNTPASGHVKVAPPDEFFLTFLFADLMQVRRKARDFSPDLDSIFEKRKPFNRVLLAKEFGDDNKCLLHIEDNSRFPIDNDNPI